MPIMTLLKCFVRLNRQSARYLETKFPRLLRRPSHYAELLARIVDTIRTENPQTIFEVGGIDRPLLRKHQAYTYVGMDIEDRPACYDVYDIFHIQSIEEPISFDADMVISTTLLEHVPDNHSAIHAIYSCLTPGGVTHHYIPSKNHPYSVALRMVGPRLQRVLIQYLRPEAEAVTGYPAFFDQCTPTQMKALFKKAGFESIDIKAFYRATDYFAFFLPAYLACALFENIVERLDIKFLASGFVITGRKAALSS